MKMLLALIGMALAMPATAQSVAYSFRWEGANGFAIDGALAFDPADVGPGFVREQDLSCFVIEGSKDGEPIGRWSLGMLRPETSWRLFFDPLNSAFLVEGQGIRMPQAWNMNGVGDNCGIGGFGFNLGNVGQDLCIDNHVIVASRIAPDAPFPATRDDTVRFPRGACQMPDLLGQDSGPPTVKRKPG